CLRQVSRRALLAYDLADLSALEPPDEPRIEPERDTERRHRGRDRAKRHVAQDVQEAERRVLGERIEEVVDHASPRRSSLEPAPSTRASTTRSMRVPREPFTRITSRSPASSEAHAAASSALLSKMTLARAPRGSLAAALIAARPACVMS